MNLDGVSTRGERVVMPAMAVGLLARGAMPVVIREHEFVDCIIMGPAVLALGATVQLRNNVFRGGDESTMDSMIWQPPEGVPVLGVIGLEAVLFERCTFENIAFACSPETAAALRATPWKD